jgi:hypothetical protein
MSPHLVIALPALVGLLAAGFVRWRSDDGASIAGIPTAESGCPAGAIRAERSETGRDEHLA